MPKTAILLVNVGTPKAPTFWAVRRYLKEFLSDRAVIQLRRLVWWPLLHGLILNTRPFRSARFYRKIWTEAGSPLLVNSQQLADRLQSQLGNDFVVGLGMRYGAPSIAQVLNSLALTTPKKLIVLPLYPQYSETTTGTLIRWLHMNTPYRENDGVFRLIHHYANFPPYIEAMRAHIDHFWRTHGRGEKIIFSFHGLPQCYIKNGDPYFEQCEETVRLLAKSLNLQAEAWCIAFQSRLGMQKWLSPSTMTVMKKLAQSGVGHVQVFCPGFAVDCLETLEEIALRNKNFFLKKGGVRFDYIGALNDQEKHAIMLAQLIETALDHE